jgi:hypothetical protein
LSKAVINFSTLQQDIAKKYPVAEKITKNSKEEVTAKVLAAKENGIKEIEQYKELVNKFSKDIGELVLFKDVDKFAIQLFIDYILNASIEPVFKGKRPWTMDEFTFKQIRTEMFKDLMAKYTD